ncbi:hypothetical protein [Enterococcus gallinarum]|uniref:hypothetical protein n=1 Tax=Enterococcus gallinarum TaxID=1353 RepID=UPI001CAA737D|nr:hypothetical protein [Enterococcus gallinarum]
MITLDEKIKILRTKSKVINIEDDGLTYHFFTDDKQIDEYVNLAELKHNLDILFKLDSIDFKTSLDRLMLSKKRIDNFLDNSLKNNIKKMSILKYYYFLSDCLNRHLEAKSYYDLMMDLSKIDCVNLNKILEKLGISKQTYYFIKANKKNKYKTRLTKRIRKGCLEIKKEVLALIKSNATDEDYQYWSTKSDTVLIRNFDVFIMEYPFLYELNYINSK